MVELGDNPMLMLAGGNPGDAERLGDNPRGSCLRSREVSYKRKEALRSGSYIPARDKIGRDSDGGSQVI